TAIDSDAILQLTVVTADAFVATPKVRAENTAMEMNFNFIFNSCF
ncbi:hypothetical protein HMPREF9553_04513, partial [Escherichia coli MS 200-1]